MSRTAVLTDQDWEAHKDLIRDIYLGKEPGKGASLGGENGVIEIMKICHGFIASKSQYETRFKRWGFRKNLKGNDWRNIGIIMAHRKREGKGTDVTVYNEQLSEAKLHKELSRNLDTLSAYQNVRPGTPTGVTICTPPLWSGELVLSPASSQRQTAVRELHSSDYAVSVSAESLMDDTANPAFLPISEELVSSSLISAYNDEPIGAFFDAPNVSSNACTNVGVDHNGLSEFRGHSRSSALEFSISWDMLSFLDGVRLGSLRAIANVYHELLTSSRDFALLASSILPSGAIAPYLPLETALFKAVVFAAFNNFAGLSDIPVGIILTALQDLSLFELNHFLEAFPAPYSEALANSLLEAALEAGNQRIVERLLLHGVDCTAIYLDGRYRKVTPIERAVELRNIEITAILVRFSAAEVTKKPGWPSRSIVEQALSLRLDALEATLPRCCIDIASILVNAGATITPGALDKVLSVGDTALMEKTLLAALHTGQIRWTGYDLVENSDAPACNRSLGRVFAWAFRQHRQDLIGALLEAGISNVPECLIHATELGDLDMFRCLVDHGADPDSLCEEDEWSSDTKTPLAAAIQKDFKEAIALFESLGVLDNLTERRRYIAAATAACQAGNVPWIKYLLSIKPTLEDWHTGYIHGYLHEERPSTALGFAATLKNIQMVSVLLEAGLRPQYRDIQLAIQAESREITRIFLSVEVSSSDEYAPDAMAKAIQWGDVDVIQDMVSAGYLLYPPPFREHDPLVIAVRKQDARLIDLLLGAGALRDMLSIPTALSAAMDTGNSTLVKLILSSGSDPWDSRALFAAARQGLPFVRMLLDAFDNQYPRIQKRFGSHALVYAICKGDMPLIRLLVPRSDLNSTNISFDQGRFVEDDLNSTNISFDQDRFVEVGLVTPLGAAIMKNQGRNLDLVRWLLDEGGNPEGTVFYPRYDHSGKRRTTALLAAVNTRHVPMVQLMIDSGATVNAPPTLGLKRTALQAAAQSGSHDVVLCLLGAGADVNAEPAIYGGGTAMQLAAIGGYIGVAELLYTHGADVNAPRGWSQGRTAFEGAAEHGRLDMLKWLVSHGADIISDGGEQYRRAMKFAKENGQSPARKLVEELYRSFGGTYVIQEEQVPFTGTFSEFLAAQSILYP